MATTKPSRADIENLRAAEAAYMVEKDTADQAIADQRSAGLPTNDVNFSLRLPLDLAVKMRKAAATQHLRTSAWLRSLISDALSSGISANDAHIERVVRRILAEEKPA